MTERERELQFAEGKPILQMAYRFIYAKRIIIMWKSLFLLLREKRGVPENSVNYVAHINSFRS